jgi:biopolymer transport protein ExbD
MRLFRRRPTDPIDADMTPMIDMTFQLIAFFMVVINFAEADQNQRIHLPSSQLAKPPEVPFENPITLQLTRPEDGKPSMVIFSGQEVPVAQVRTLLNREKQFLTLRKQKPSSATVIIRADADAETGTVQQLIKICQEIGFEKFALRAKQEET